MYKNRLMYYGATVFSFVWIGFGCNHESQTPSNEIKNESSSIRNEPTNLENPETPVQNTANQQNNPTQPNEAADDAPSMQQVPASLEKTATTSVQNATKQQSNPSQSIDPNIRAKAAARFEKGVWEKLSKRKTKIPDEILEGIESCWKTWESLDLNPAHDENNQAKMEPIITDIPMIEFGLPHYQDTVAHGLTSKQIEERSRLFRFRDENGRTEKRVVYKLHGKWGCSSGDPFTNFSLFRNIDWKPYRSRNAEIGFLLTYDIRAMYLVVIPDGKRIDKARFYRLKGTKEPHAAPYYKVEESYKTIEEIISELIKQAKAIRPAENFGGEK